jgi:hypothetical protein
VVLSHPVVEAFYLEGQRGAVVTLANYALRPIDRLDIQVLSGRTVRRVESVRQGVLRFGSTSGKVTAHLPLQDTDMLKLYW